MCVTMVSKQPSRQRGKIILQSASDCIEWMYHPIGVERTRKTYQMIGAYYGIACHNDVWYRLGLEELGQKPSDRMSMRSVIKCQMQYLFVIIKNRYGVLA